MAEFLINKNESWMNALIQQEIDNYQAQNVHFLDKYESRKKPGDIVNITEDGFWDQASDWGSHAYYLMKIPGLSLENAKNYRDSLEREVIFERTLNDTTNHIYEYTATVVQNSVSGIELFKVREFIVSHLPPDVTILSKSSVQVLFRLEPLKHPGVISGNSTPIERRDKVQQLGKEFLVDFMKCLRKFRYRIRIEDLPQIIKDQLANNEAATITWQQGQDYLDDKGLI